MKLNRLSSLLLALAMITLAGCPTATYRPPSALSTGRYYTKVEKIPEGTVTHLIDSKHNKEVLYIAELDGDTPSINVLPMSRLDVDSVSVDSLGKEGVLIGYHEKSDMNLSSVSVNSPGVPMAAVIAGFDQDKDGLSEIRMLRMSTETGFMEYFDLDANGKLDAQVEIMLDGSSPQQVHILVGLTWIPVEGDKDLLLKPPHTATAKAEPKATYHFKDGVWAEPN